MHGVKGASYGGAAGAHTRYSVGQAWERQHKTNGNAHSESRRCKKIRKRAAPTTSVTNMNGLGRNFVEEARQRRLLRGTTSSSSVKSGDGRRRRELKYVLFCWASQIRGYVNMWHTLTEAYCFTSQPTCGEL